MKRLLLLLLAASGPLLPAAAAEKPNILFIFTDDLAYQAISSYGESRKLLDTPNLDRLAREGMRFNRALVPNSICGPSRATVLTGKYSHLNGFPNNSNSRFDPAQVTFPKLLQQAGYQTSIIGKWHLLSDPAGFDHWQILPGQGVYYQPPFIRNGEKIVEDGYVTDIITHRSIEWLEKRDKTKPFLLMTQHKAPHREWAPAIRHLDHDKGRVYPEPPTLFDDYANRGTAVRDQDMTLANTFTPRDAKLNAQPRLTPEEKIQWDAYYEPRNEAFRKADPQGDDLVRWRYNRYLHDYLGTVKSVDESVGELLKYLDDHDLAKNTIVVFSSDQGFYLGEHGWFDKRWIFEESLRTPLLVRWPGVTKPGTVNGDLVSTVDFAQTFLEAADVPAPADVQGRSLVPVLKSETPADWRKSFYYHYYEYPDPHHVRPHYGVVTDRYKLVHFYKPDVDYWELYDLEKDPHETRDFYNDPGYTAIRADLHQELDRLRKELKVPDPDPAGYSGGKSGAAPAATSAAPAPAASPPNIVVIFADDLGYGDLGTYGAKGWKTPNLDRMAAEGNRFTRFYVPQPVCSASRAGLLTGCYPSRVSIQGALPPRSKTGIADGEVTIAELLKQKGYATGIIGKWHLGDSPQFLPTRHGFDEYLGLPYSNDMWPHRVGLATPAQAKRRQNHPPLRLLDGETAVIEDVTAADQELLTGRYTERAVQFIQRNKEKPFFLYLAHSMPHVPLYAGEKYRGKSERGIFGDVIQEIDASVGAVLEALRANGLDEKTLVVFTSDNGPWLNYGTHAGTAGPLREGKGTVWEGGVREPFIARWPGRIPAGHVTEEPAMTIDLLPTFARLSGARLPAHTIDGKDVWPLLAGESGARNPQEAYYFYYKQNELQAVLQGEWKLYLPHSYRTLAGKPGGTDGVPAQYEQRQIETPELYNVVADVSETTNAAPANPEIVQRLLALADKARAELGDSLTQTTGKGVRPAGKLEE